MRESELTTHPFCHVLDCGELGDNLATIWIVELVSTRVQRGSCLTPVRKAP